MRSDQYVSARDERRPHHAAHYEAWADIAAADDFDYAIATGDFPKHVSLGELVVLVMGDGDRRGRAA